MGFFSGLEGSLEKYIEGFFRDKFRGRVQPLDIAKKLAREMRDRKRVSVNLVYAPNDYDVYLNPEDLASILYLAEALSEELQEYLRQKAEEKDFTMVADPRVNFFEDNGLKPGQIRVSGKFGNTSGSTSESRDSEAEEGNTFEDTLNFRRVSIDTSPMPVIKQKSYCFLEVVEGPVAGKIFRLTDFPSVVGRRDSCDIIIQDESVSRRHARLEPQEGSWLVTDLDSTNGTFVNGERMKTKLLAPGDTVKFGAVLCALKVD
ncbi:MAG: FhaA domain-containing protein [Desulfocucumaceae bacterium]